MPPVLAEHFTPALQARSESFYRGVAEMFDHWASRHGSSHTRRAYRRDVLSFVEFVGLRWPQQAKELLRASDEQRLVWITRSVGETGLTVWPSNLGLLQFLQLYTTAPDAPLEKAQHRATIRVSTMIVVGGDDPCLGGTALAGY